MLRLRLVVAYIIMYSMTMKRKTFSAREVRELFAGELDYANVTEFRESLLPAVSDIERNRTKRYLVTKHGKPLAVFLSFEAFEAIRKLVETVLAQEDGKNPSQILLEASQRMDRDYNVEAADVATSVGAVSELSAQIQAVHENFQRIESLLTDYAKRTEEGQERVRSR